MSYCVIWEFHIDPSRQFEFEAAYGSDGVWARLFERAAGFLGLELLRSAEDEGRYITIDRWESQSDFEAFGREFIDEYSALDQRLEGLSIRETRVGAFLG